MTTAGIAAAAGGTVLSSHPVLAYSARMSARPDDTALMLRYRDGDVQAFEVLYRRHNDALYRYLLRHCGQPASAEDLYQEVWSRVIAARLRYRPTAKFTTWLYRIAHNCFIDYLRRNKHQHALADVDPDATPSELDEPHLIAERQIARSRLDSLLGALPAEQRDAFLLHEEAGLALEDIARISGTNRETIKSRLRYAQTKLRKGLQDAGGIPPAREPKSEVTKQ